jgi:hypothetical protein
MEVTKNRCFAPLMVFGGQYLAAKTPRKKPYRALPAVMNAPVIKYNIEYYLRFNFHNKIFTSHLTVW